MPPLTAAALLDVGESSQLGLMGVSSVPDGLNLMAQDPAVSASISRDNPGQAKPGAKKPLSDGFSKGFEDASQCYSQNSASRCAGVAADQHESCLADYHGGYQVGDKQRARLMEEAREMGRRAAGKGELANSASNPLADGPCRVEWIVNYNQGYFKERGGATK